MSDYSFPYSNALLTEHINRIPNTYGLLNELSLFRSEQIYSYYVPVTLPENNKSSIFSIPHFPIFVTIPPQKVKYWNNIVETLSHLHNHYSMTREYLRLEALKGIIRDAKNRIVYDLYQVFGISKKIIDFALDSDTTDIISKCDEITQYMVQNLKGEPMTKPAMLVSNDFFNKFIQHKKIEKYWLNSQNALNLASIPRNTKYYYGRSLEFQNILFQEYVGYVPIKNASGATKPEPLIAPNTGHAYPLGTHDVFRTYDGPLHHMERVNQPGEEIFVEAKILDFGEGVVFKAQSNILSVCLRPELLVEVRSGSAEAAKR